ncbi:MAG TPA: YihY/virulence factor BrkB family protein [Myxococcaceae bacterium]|nr:YihY/virulence factor BrkB family protein [Myxococcaceae bacterium]
MPAALGNVVTVARETVSRWSEDKASTLAAALAYYAVFSLAPLLLIAIAVAGLVFGERAAEGQLYSQLAGVIGDGSARAVQRLVANLHQQKTGGIVATVVGVATLLFGASGLFVQLQGSMNTIWKTSPPPAEGIRGFLRSRLVSFSMVMAMGLLLLLSLMLSAVGAYVSAYLPQGVGLSRALDVMVGLVLATLLFAMIFKVLPDTTVSWRDVWFGALVTAVLFTLGKIGIGLYLGRASVASSYGAAGSLVILLLWIYYSALILYFGAEFTRVYSTRHGSRRLYAGD